MNKNRRPTLQDIANLVGVTKMTVSRCLSSPSKVSEDLQLKIKDAVELLGYIPNKAPCILSNSKSKSIGVLLPSLTNQVFAEVLRGIEKITMPADYQIMIAHYGYSQIKEEKSIASLLSYNVDGMILSESIHSAKSLKMIATAGIPIIEIMDSVTPAIDQAVGIDNEAAGYAMTQAMIKHDHKNIVYFAARMDQRTKLKKNGYIKAMSENNFKPVYFQTEEASSYSLGAKLLHQVLEQYPETDGIFSTNDDLAVGALYECQRLGIEVPKQMAIAGFHGNDICKVMVPKLATVITPRKNIGIIAAEQLLKKLNDEEIKDPCINLDFEIFEGESI